MDLEGKGITVDNEDLQESVNAISKLSSERILPFFEIESHGEIQKLSVPVRDYNTSDRKDTAMRRYMQDWIKRKVENVSVDTRFEVLARGTSYYAEDKEYPVVGCLIITWWPKKPGDDYEEWKRKRQQARDS